MECNDKKNIKKIEIKNINNSYKEKDSIVTLLEEQNITISCDQNLTEMDFGCGFSA